MIQARHPTFNIEFGRYIKPLEWQVTKYGKKSHNFGKGNYDEVGARIDKLRVQYTHYTEGDHSTFDAHVTKEMLQLTHRFYRECYEGYRSEINELTKRTLVNKCRSRRGDSYKVEGTRMSGDVDTSFGNCLINYAILKECLAIHGLEGDAIVNGDDFILFTNEVVPPTFRDTLLTFNMETEMKPTTTNIHTVEFCRAKMIINSAGRITMMADIERLTKTFGMTHKLLTDYALFLLESLICCVAMNQHSPTGNYWRLLWNAVCAKLPDTPYMRQRNPNDSAIKLIQKYLKIAPEQFYQLIPHLTQADNALKNLTKREVAPLLEDKKKFGNHASPEHLKTHASPSNITKSSKIDATLQFIRTSDLSTKYNFETDITLSSLYAYPYFLTAYTSLHTHAERFLWPFLRPYRITTTKARNECNAEDCLIVCHGTKQLHDQGTRLRKPSPL